MNELATNGDFGDFVYVPFGTGAIQCVVGKDGRLYAVPKRVCDDMGLTWSTQLQKLRDSDWARVSIMTTLDANGHRQKTCVIPLDDFHTWLQTIHVGKVAPEIREQLSRYRADAKAAVLRHFHGSADHKVIAQGATTTPPVSEPVVMPSSPLAALGASVLQQAQVLVQVINEVETVRVTAQSAETKADAALAEVATVKATLNLKSGYNTLRGFCNIRKIHLTKGQDSIAGRQLSTMSRAAGVPIYPVPDERYGEVGSYRDDILERWHQRLTGGYGPCHSHPRTCSKPTMSGRKSASAS